MDYTQLVVTPRVLTWATVVKRRLGIKHFERHLIQITMSEPGTPSPKSVTTAHKIKIIFLSILVLVISVVIYKIVYFEIFKLCGNCGNPGNRNVAAKNLQLDDSDNDKTFTLVQGKTATVVLGSTYWKFQPVADTSVLKLIGDPVYQAASKQVVFGTGAGTVTAEFDGVAVGQTQITASRTVCGEDLACPPDQQNYTVTINVVTSLTSNDYRNYSLVYWTSNGSLPPPYHEEKVLTVSEDAAGVIRATYDVKNYTKVLQTSNLSVTSDQLIALMNTGLTASPNQPDALAGCTGGSSKSLTISQNGKTILETGAYTCGGKSSNADFEKFANKVGELFPQF